MKPIEFTDWVVMSYLHVLNLYRPEGQEIVLFRECYAMEKIRG